MSRCDCEGLFYRVFCVSLLVIAFTFTVILTNVFVDIDNLLSKRERESTENMEIEHVTNGVEVTTDVQDYYIGAEKDAGNYRSKRSLVSDPDNFFIRINSPKTKSYLTNKLATLLEALDGEDSDNTTPKPENGNIYIKTVKQKNNIEINELQPESERRPEMQLEENIIYLALHNMLQGIGHVDLHELIDKLQILIRSLKHEENEKDSTNAEIIQAFYSETTPKGRIDVSEALNLLKNKFGDRRIKSNTLDFNVAANADITKGIRTSEKPRKNNKNPTYVIKTLINIEKDKEANSNEDVQGIIKLIYNGKPIKIKSDDSSEATIPVKRAMTMMKQNTTKTNSTITSDVEDFASVLKNKFKNRPMRDTYLKTITQEYLKKFEKLNDSLATVDKKKIRIKRNLDSSYEKQMESTHTKDDDELFVEIETHFDKSGMDGEKKRKLVTSLIEKIQNAIRSSNEKGKKDRNQREPLMKRIQSPLDRRMSSEQPRTSVSSAYRYLDPISKSVPIVDPLPLVTNQNGEAWKIPNPEPKFLSTSKSINSAELSQLAVEYKSNDKNFVIPQRIQLPLSIDSSRETINTEDLGKLQLLFKDIEGSGFSIGYNQYVDQSPDPESMKLFHGIEEIVKKYHQKQDNPDQLENYEGDYETYGQQMKKREVSNGELPLRTKRFVINRRNIRQSVKKVNNYRKNEYIYNDHYHSFNTYKEVHDNSKKSNEVKEKKNIAHRQKRSATLKTLMNSNKKIRVNKYLNTHTFPKHKRFFKTSHRIKRQVDISANDKTDIAPLNSNMFFVTGGELYNDNLVVRRRQKPDLFFIEVIKSNKENPFLKNQPLFQPNNNKFTSLTTQIKKLNTYNQNPMFTKSTSNDCVKHENKERNKRQLHKLRIIDRDMAQRNSNQKEVDEYGGNIYANKGLITELDGSQIIAHEKEERKIIYKNPFIFESNEHISFKHTNPILPVKNTNFKHNFNLSPTWEEIIKNPVMAKYPHIFEKGETREEHPQEKQLRSSMFFKAGSEETDSFDNEKMYHSSNVQDLLKAVIPTQRKSYKVSIRLLPHDIENDTKPGFKEIHTSINKTFNENGLMYSSLVNVSEISKVEVPHDINMNRSRIFSHYFKSTTPHGVETKKPLEVESVLDSNLLTNTTDNNSVKKMQITRSKPSDIISNASMDMNLLDIVLPSSPRRVFHLTVADLGKLILDAMKSQNSEKVSATQPEIHARKIATSTTTAMPTELHSTYATTPTIDPLKMKLLKAISQNEQLTNQILNRIDQNTDILQTFLSKITRELAKLPEIVKQERIEKGEKSDPYQNVDPESNIHGTTTTKIVPITYANQESPQNTKAATTRYFVRPSPLLKNRVYIDKRPELPKVTTNNEELKQNGHAKYFFDSFFLNKTSVPKEIMENVPNRPIVTNQLTDGEPSKPNNNLDRSQASNTSNNIDRNAIVKNNTINELTRL